MPPVNEELRFNATLQDGFSSDFRRLTSTAQAGTTRLGNSLNRFGDVARTATVRIGLFTAATVALGKGVETFISRNAELVDAIGKSAEATGLAIDEYQSLRLQFELAGGSARGFETAMRTLSRSIGDANRGVGQGRQIFEDLGIALRDSGGNIRDTAAVLDDLNTALSTLTSDSQRNSILAALVGSRNTTASNLLFQQFSGRSLVSGATSTTGATLGGTFTDEQADSFAEWNDEFTKLQATLDVLFTNISVQMADGLLPHLKDLQQSLADVNRNFDSFIDRLAIVGDSAEAVGQTIVTAIIGKSLAGRVLSFASNKALGRGFSFSHTAEHGRRLGAVDRGIASFMGKKADRGTAVLGALGTTGHYVGLSTILASIFGFGSNVKNAMFPAPGSTIDPSRLYDGDYMQQFFSKGAGAGIDGGGRILGEGTPVQVIIKDIAPELKQGTGTPMAMPIPDGLGIPTTTTTPAKSAAARQREVFEFQEMMGKNSYNASLIADSAGLLADHSKKAAKIQVVASTAAAIMQQFATPGLWFGLAWVNAAIILRLGREQLKAIDSGQLSEIGNAPATTTQTQIQTVNTQAAAFDYSLQLGTGQQGVGNIQNLSDALRNSRGLVDTGGI